eukprot:550583-Prymnesium_polylepis.1
MLQLVPFCPALSLWEVVEFIDGSLAAQPSTWPVDAACASRLKPGACSCKLYLTHVVHPWTAPQASLRRHLRVYELVHQALR